MNKPDNTLKKIMQNKLSEQKKREYAKIYRYWIYLKLRKEVKKIFKNHDFQCAFPKCFCCTSILGFYPEDYYFLKEKGLDVSGLDVHFIGDEIAFISDTTKEIELFNDKGERIHRTGICYYEILDKDEEHCGCKLHPNNPFLCYTFPIVLNLEDESILNKTYHCPTKFELTTKEQKRLYQLMRKYNKIELFL